MELLSKDIEVRPITFAYVAVWKKALPNIPPLDLNFCKSVFSKPESTQVGFNQQGLSISLPPTQEIVNQGGVQAIMMPLVPNLLLGYQRYSIFHNSIEGILGAHDKLFLELKNNSNSFFSTLSSAQVGINMEFELKIPTNASKWLVNRFVKKENNVFKDIQFQELKFIVEEDERGKKMTIQFQPRITNENLIYCSINDHYGISPTESMFDTKQLQNFIEKTINKVQEQIVEYLINK